MKRALPPTREQLAARVRSDLLHFGYVLFDTQLAIWRFCDDGVVALEGPSPARGAVSSEVFAQTLRRFGARVEYSWSPPPHEALLGEFVFRAQSKGGAS